jgi:hypothetical protein
MPDDDDDGAAGDERPDADGGPLPCACVYARLAAWREKWLSDGEAACLTGSGSRQRDGSEEEDH